MMRGVPVIQCPDGRDALARPLRLAPKRAWIGIQMHDDLVGLAVVDGVAALFDSRDIGAVDS